jgi:protein tyrosine phosphatase (PTP) superfamily phosphohydrolase (DUF442 family)
MRPALLLMSSLALLSACATTPTPTPEAPRASAPAPALSKAQRHDAVVVAGQPLQTELSELRALGIEHVFNLRTAEEMAALGYDEAAELARLGIGYEQHAVAGGSGFTPELLAAFAAAMERHPGKVLLHCASGSRAGQLYAAYAVKYRGLDIDAAMRLLEPSGNWPLPIERMLGEPLRVVRASSLHAPVARARTANAVDQAIGRDEFATCPQ